METAIVYWGYNGGNIGIMENQMETAIVYWGFNKGNMGIMENQMETTIVYCQGLGVGASGSKGVYQQKGALSILHRVIRIRGGRLCLDSGWHTKYGIIEARGVREFFEITGFFRGVPR